MTMLTPLLLTLAWPAVTLAPVGKAPAGRPWAQMAGADRAPNARAKLATSDIVTQHNLAWPLAEPAWLLPPPELVTTVVLDVLPWLDAISETTTIWLWMWLQMTLQVLFIFLASLLRDQVGRRMVCIGGDARDQKLREAVSQKRFFLSEPSWSLPVWALALGLSG